MIINKTLKYTHIKNNQNSIQQFLIIFNNRYSEFINQHLIIDFSEKINIKTEEFILFLETSVKHKENGTSFVLVYSGTNIDNLPEEISVVPTFNEAVDILEMDAIERDLGF